MSQPIVYQGLIATRFGETDMYGHISSKHFLDYAVSMRWDFFEERFQTNADALLKRGLAFFMTRSEINYKRSIKAGMTVMVTSFVEEIKGSTLLINFKIESKDQKKLFSDGFFTFAIMDVTTMRPQSLPEWAYHFFYEDESP